MRFVRGLLALVTSSLFVVLLVEANRYIRDPSEYFEVELNAQFFTVWVLSDSVPILCWLFVLVPLLVFSRVLDRWSLRKAGFLGFITGVAVTMVILLVIANRIEGTKWKVMTILSLLCGIAMAIQFIVASLTKRWARTTVPTPSETEHSSHS